MKKNYAINKQVLLSFLLLFTVHFATVAQSKSNWRLDHPSNPIGVKKNAVQPTATSTEAKSSSTTASPFATSTVSACDSYTWPVNGTTYFTSGIYTSPGGGITQGFNNQGAWSTSAADNGATVNSNNLNGLASASPIVVTIGGVTVTINAPGGMYSSGTFVGTNLPNEALTLTFSTPVYGLSANIFDTNISDVVISGNVTATYSDGFVDSRTVTADTELFGYFSTTPITSLVLTTTTTTPNRYICLRNLFLATNPTNILNLTIGSSPFTAGYTVCQGATVSGGLTSSYGGGPAPLPNYVGNTTGGPTYNRPLAMNQGGTCGNSGVGNAVVYATHTFVAPVSGNYSFSTCSNASWDTFLALYQDPFNPAGLCAGNTLVAAADDSCGAQSTLSATLVQGTSYTLVISGFANTDFGTYIITSTTPPTGSVEWYTAPTGGTAIATNSPFNPVGVPGSGITDTNTPGSTTFYAQYPGDFCRTAAVFTITEAPTTTAYSICQGGTVSGGLTATLGGTGTPLPNFVGDNTGGSTYNRPLVMNQGGTCGNSGVGNAVQYVAHTFTAPVTGAYVFSTCSNATFDTFLALYQAPFNPAGLCAGNTLVASADDNCGAQSTVTANLVQGTTYTLVVSGFANTDAGPYIVTSTTPSGPSVEWYTASSGGSAIGVGSPFNPVGATGSGITNTNTPGATTFYAQYPGGTCRTPAVFTITAPTTPTFTAVPPICIGATLSALPTTSNNGITGTWAPAINNTTTTTYTFTPDAGQCATTTTLEIVVNPLPTITCPGNITVCEGEAVNYTVTTNAIPNISLTQSTSSVPVAGSVACNPGGDNTFYRVYDLAALGYSTGLLLDNIRFSVESSAVNKNVTVSAYTLTGAFLNANLTLLGSTVVPVTTAPLTNYVAAMGGLTVPGNSKLVVAYSVPSDIGNAFLPGANAAGQTSPSYLKAAACTVNEPTNYADLGFPNMHLIIDIDAQVIGGGGLTMDSGLPSGSVFPLGTTTVSYTATSASGCQSSCSFDVIVNPNVAPTFDPVAPICSGATLAALPTTSNNGITGTWAPALDNTTTTTYTFTPDAGQCALTATLTITVNPIVTPTFTAVAPICEDAALAPLPTTSNNGITGTWAPAIDNTVTTTYTFTPDAGQCGTTTTMTIVVNPNPIVTFSANPFPVCAGSSTVLTANTTNATPTISFVDGSAVNQNFNMNVAAFGVPVTSPLSGILVNVGSNGCAALTPGSLTGKIALIQRGTCTFVIKALNAQNAGAIGVILYNNAAGAFIPGGTDPSITIPVYGITQANGLALIASMTANEVPVTLSPAPALTYLWSTGDTTISTNTGVLNANTDFTVLVTNTVTGCSTSQTVTVPVTPNIVPTFTPVAAICSGDALAPLPTTSTEGVVGTWSPALDNTATTTYTFTPTPVAGQCLAPTTMTITVNSVTSNTTTVSACDSYTWSVNGSTYTTSGTYTSTTGCATETLNLTINSASTPTGSSTQTISVVNANDATLANVVVSPTSVVWYGSLTDALAATGALPLSTILTNGGTYYAVNVVGSCSSTPFAVTTTVVLGNELFTDFDFTYAPNPTSTVLNIRCSNIITEVSVINLLGQVIKTQKANAADVQIDMSSLPEATYFVKVVSDEKEKIVKVTKKD